MFVNTLAQKTIEALDPAARALLKKPVTAAGTRFSFSSLDGRDPETLSRLICSAAAYLDRDDSEDEDEDEDDGDCAFDPLSLTVFKSEGGDFIVDADFAVGGPTIRARYEARWDTLEIYASWGRRYGADLSAPRRVVVSERPASRLRRTVTRGIDHESYRKAQHSSFQL